MKKFFDKYGKKKVCFTVLGIALVVSLSVVAIFMSINHDTVKLAVKNQVVEYGENPYDVKLDKVIKDYDKLIKDKKLKDIQLSLVQDKKEIKKSDITKEKLLPVGKYVLNITSGKKIKLALNVEVKDTIAPKFIDFNKEVVIEENAQNVDITKYFKAEDLSGVNITVDKAKLDLSKAGTYEIKVIAVDKYKNKAANIVTIKVVTLEQAEKDGVSATIEGTKPQSKALKDKKAADAKAEAEAEAARLAEEQRLLQEQQNKEVQNNSNNQNSGNSNGGGNSWYCIPGPNGHYDRWYTSDAGTNYICDHSGMAYNDKTGEIRCFWAIPDGIFGDSPRECTLCVN